MEEKSLAAKRGRKRVFKDDKEGNRVRSQRHRENKNNYISKLEEEIKELKETVAKLTQEVEFWRALLKMKNISADKDTEEFRFLREEDYAYKDFANVITNLPALVRSVTHFQQWDSSGMMNESRIKFIK